MDMQNDPKMMTKSMSFAVLELDLVHTHLMELANKNMHMHNSNIPNLYN